MAVVDGSLTKNLNEIRVRLWTDPSFDQDGKISSRNTLDPIPHESNRAARSNQRRRAIGATSRACKRPSAVRTLNLQKQPGYLCSRRQHPPRPFIDGPCRIKDRLEPRPSFDWGSGQVERDDIGTTAVVFVVMTQADRCRPYQRAKLFLESISHHPWFPNRRQSTRQCLQHRRGRARFQLAAT